MSDSITTQHRYYNRYTAQWDKVRHCIEGEDTIKDQSTRYLPQPSGQTINEYESYRTRASFYSVAERTLRGMTGMIFRNEPVLRLPEALNPWRVAATNELMCLQMFIEEVTREVIAMGRYGVLLDFPAGASVGTLPHMVAYNTDSIINWREEFVNGKKILTSLTLKDSLSGDDSTVDSSWLKLELVEGIYTVQRWAMELVEGKPVATMRGSAVTPTVNGELIKHIPFVFFNPYDHRPEPSKPPFIDLCNMNLAHYRNSADYEHALYLTAQPTPWVAGQLDEKTKPTAIGSGTIWYLPEDAKAGMLEFTGKGLEAQRMAMQDKEDRMASLGARMIKDTTRVQEKAETARLRTRGETSLVLDTLQSVEKGLSMLMRQAAVWVGADPDEVELRLNRDFVDSKIDANMLAALVKTWQTGAISRDTLHANLQRGEVMDMGRTAEEEKELIDEEGEFIPDADAPVNLGGDGIDITPTVPGDR